MESALRKKCADLLGGLLQPFYRGIGCVFCFHRIVPKEKLSAFADNRALEITPAALRDILEWVRRQGFEVIRMDEVRARLASPRGEKFVVFTFDDGYRDNLTAALPIFRDFGMPFTLNVTTGFVSGTTSVWWYSLEDALSDRAELAFSWKGEQQMFSLTSQEERERAFAGIAQQIRAQDRGGRDALVAAFCEAAGVDPLARTRELMMSWDELKAAAGDWHVNFGSHTVGHHTLSRLSDAEVEEELIDARAELEARIGKPARHLAYPFGGRDAVGKREFEIARDADFTTATTTRTANLFHQHAWHLQALPRLGVSGNYPALERLRKLESGLVPAKENGWKRVVVE